MADGSGDVVKEIEFVSGEGRVVKAAAFWDGGRTWRVRAALPEVGLWDYRVDARDGCFLPEQMAGSIEVSVPETQHPTLSPGRLRVAADGFHLEDGNGRPFFYLADTAWNGVLKAKLSDWERYLAVRKEQGFTAVQCVLTHWRSFPADELGEKAFVGEKPIRINPGFFQRLDDKVAAINRHGLVAALVLLWACTEKDPGHYLPEEDAVRLARYLVARYGAYRVIWMLGGDGDYRGGKAERWRRIGRALFGDNSSNLVTMHPGGQHWVADEFRGESWFDFVSYQSGHGDSDEHLRWLVEGPPAKDWVNEPHRPIINQEPNYEAHHSYHSKRTFEAYEVRRALYWSLLVSPTAGVTYGHHGIWPWMEEPGVPLDHPETGSAPSWYKGLDSPGAVSVTHLKEFFSALEWWTLRPAPELLETQPGDANPARFIAAAKAETNDFAVVYTPVGGSIPIRCKDWQPGVYRWYNPRTGEWGAKMQFSDSLTTPDQQDWVLWIGR